MKRIFALAAVALLAAMPAQAAEDRGFYWGFDLGQYQYSLDRNDLDDGLVSAIEDEGFDAVVTGSETSEDGFTWGLTFGYQILRFLAVEAAWVDLGSAEYKADVDVSDGVTIVPASAKLTADSAGATLSVLGIVPFGGSGWQAYARAGVYFAGNDLDVQGSSANLGLDGETSDNTQEFLWGLGAGYSAGQWTTRLEYQQYVDVGEDDAEVDVDRIVLGAIYRF